MANELTADQHKKLKEHFQSILEHHCQTSYTNRGGWTSSTGIRPHHFVNVVNLCIQATENVIKDGKH